MATKPTPRTWTLRLKHHRTTVLIHADPLTKMPVLKAEILKAISETHPDGTLNGDRIPSSADDILLAKPVDINDLSLGWENLDQTDEFGEELSESKGKGKGKAVVGAVGKNKVKGKNTLLDNPLGAGLRDGGVVAFKFRSKDDRVDIAFGDEDGADELGDGVLADVKKDDWDVVVPTLEETYPEGEVGRNEAAG